MLWNMKRIFLFACPLSPDRASRRPSRKRISECSRSSCHLANMFFNAYSFFRHVFWFLSVHPQSLSKDIGRCWMFKSYSQRSNHVAEMGEDVVALGFPLGQNSLKISKGGRLMMVAVVYRGTSFISTSSSWSGLFCSKISADSNIDWFPQDQGIFTYMFSESAFFGSMPLGTHLPCSFYSLAGINMSCPSVTYDRRLLSLLPWIARQCGWQWDCQQQPLHSVQTSCQNSRSRCVVCFFKW